ncbi:MAG: ABC transporter ATP-binding protein [Hyphomicrobiales bacterium]|nr:ABC transporter ATP-binding protein [Hyphomicrobiales bacterium]
MKSTIELRDVTKNFGQFTAVRDVDLFVDAGEVVCLLGPSGCGKTTTLRMIAGLETPSAGDILFGKSRVNNLTPEQRNVAMVFQFYALYPALSVEENLTFPLFAEHLSKSKRQARVADVAEILQLTDILNRKPSEIAEGEKQRVAVARAIIREPNCFLFDEPLSRLDVELRESMRGQIKEVLQGLSKPTVIVTHDQLEALTMADRITIMRDGLIEQIGTPHEVFTKPVNIFVASFIGTPQMNLLGVELIRCNGNDAEVVLDGNPLKFGVEAIASELSPGEITLGIRPRAFSLQSESGKDAISVTSEIIEPMGAETLVHARTISETEIRVVVPREKKVTSGETLHLRPDPGQTLVFNKHGKAAW